MQLNKKIYYIILFYFIRNICNYNKVLYNKEVGYFFNNNRQKNRGLLV
jgi:hypothetical protein